MSKLTTKNKHRDWLPITLPDNIKELKNLIRFEKKFGEPELAKKEIEYLKKLIAEEKNEK